MPYINKNFINERLLPSVPIEKLINQYVPLKKSGSNYTCCCPFHHEKTPSFSVSASKQMFYCFGCKEHGTVIDFIMKYKNLGFVEAVEDLASFAGLEVEYEKGTGASKSEQALLAKYYELMDKCGVLFTRALHSPEGAEGLRYFQEKRRLSNETITKARLGFAPSVPYFLEKTLGNDPATIRQLTDLGMLVPGTRGTHAMYHNRVMIPIFDRKGRIISFGGRTLGDEKPKYLNTKDSPVYHKRKELFGLYEALSANNNRPPFFVVVEGYMDVISVREAGLTCAVASLGTATTPEQISMMFRYSDKIIFCYDGDSAGQKAAWHAWQTVTPLLQEDKEIRFSFLPPEHDPDSLVKEQGLDAFEDYLKNSMAYTEYLVSHIRQEFNLQDPNGLSSFISQTLRHIKEIPIKSVQLVAIKVLSNSSGMPETHLYDSLNSLGTVTEGASVRSKGTAEQTVEKNADGSDLLKTPMRKLIAFVIQQPIVVATVQEQVKFNDFIEYCSNLGIRGVSQLRELYGYIAAKPDITPANLVEATRDQDIGKIVSALMEAPIKTRNIRGDELPFETRVDYFVELLELVLTTSLKQKMQEVKLRVSQNVPGALQEHQAIVRAFNFNK